MLPLLQGCDRILKTAVRKQMSGTRLEMLTDKKLHVILVGSGGPMPNTERVSSSTAVIVNGEFILVDTGPGAARNALLQKLPVGSLRTVLLTHFHSDHIADLGEVNMFSWVQGRKAPLDVYGPEGVEKVVSGFTQAYELDSLYRTAHHGETVAPARAGRPKAHTIAVDEDGAMQPVLSRNGLKVYAFVVNHDPAKPAVGYRFEYHDRVVVISGDTKQTPYLAEHARGADLFICDALDAKLVGVMADVATELRLQETAKIMSDIPDYHLTPVQAAEVAQAAGVRKLVFTHVVPPISNFALKRIYLEGVSDAFHGDVVVGEDGMTFELAPR